MKIIFVLLLTISVPLFAQSNWIEKSDIAESVDSALIKSPEKNALDAAIVKVQIDADEAHGAFISEPVSREDMYTLTGSVQISRKPGMSLLYEFLTDKKDITSAVKWSNAIAKNKYAKGSERLALPRSVIETAIQKGWFKRSTNLLDCEPMKVKVKSVDGDNLNVSFYPSLLTKGELLRSSSSQVDAANSSLNGFISFVSKKATEEKLSSVSGIVFAYTVNGKALQSCELNIPLSP